VIVLPAGSPRALTMSAETGRLDAFIRALDGHEEDLVRTGYLYGVPEAGRWCVVAVDGEVLVPTGRATVLYIRDAVDAVIWTVESRGWTMPTTDSEFVAMRERLERLADRLRALVDDPGHRIGPGV
jgi:hypothetical protein